MKCYKCDKCGDVVLSENVNLMEIWNSGASGLKYDLCPFCAATIRHIIKSNLMPDYTEGAENDR